MMRIGTDILEIARLEAVVERQGQRFVDRILTPAERVEYAASTIPVRLLAKRFAAKEAIAKALGTGIGRGVSWQHMQIDHDALGAPVVTLTDGALARACDQGTPQVSLSLADEQHYVVAFAVLTD